jgi:hypothetical protein
MARHTQATLTARVGMAARALGLPLHHHTGPDGFAVGALRLTRANGHWSLFQITNNAGAGDLLICGDGGDVVAFLSGMVAAGNVAAFARRFDRATAPTLPTLRADAAAGRPVSLAALARVVG